MTVGELRKLIEASADDASNRLDLAAGVALLQALALADIAESLRAIQLSLAQAFGRGGPVYQLLEKTAPAETETKCEAAGPFEIECGVAGPAEATCSLPARHDGKHVDVDRGIWWTEKFE
jgi:hypothetical protein